jgi:hypothetical protein
MADEFFAAPDDALRVVCVLRELSSRTKEVVSTTQAQIAPAVASACVINPGDSANVRVQVDHLLQVAKRNTEVLDHWADSLERALNTFETSDRGGAGSVGPGYVAD